MIVQAAVPREPEPCRVRRGIVTTHPDRPPSREEAHFAITCCGDRRCIRKFRTYVQAIFHKEATYVAD